MEKVIVVKIVKRRKERKGTKNLKEEKKQILAEECKVYICRKVTKNEFTEATCN